MTTVALDAVGPSSSGDFDTTASAGMSWSHTNAGNALIVAVSNDSGSSSLASAVNYGGTPLSFLGYQRANGTSGTGGASIFGVISASLPTGANTVTVTTTSGTSTGGSISVTGAGSFGTLFTAAASAASISATVTGTTSGGLIICAATYGGTGLGSFTAATGGTIQDTGIGNNNSGSNNMPIGTWASPGGSQAVGFSVAGGGDWWGLVAVEIIPAGAISGPNYAGAASDKADGSGSWVNPIHAVGAADSSYAVWTVP